MTNKLKQKYDKEIVPALASELGFKSAMSVPRLVKITVNSGVGHREDKDIEAITKQMELITGQKCVSRGAKKSIASFKVRQGATVGVSCTLRGSRMYDFLEKTIKIALARIRDFRGLDPKSADSSGNLTIGLKEHIVFPEITGEDVRTPFGLEVTLVTNAKTRDEAIKLFEALGVPFKK